MNSPSKNTDFKQNRPRSSVGIATCFLCFFAYTLSTGLGVPPVTVYIDAVAVLNFLVNFLLLYATARLGAAAARMRRLALGALLGAVYAVCVYLPGLDWLRLFPFKLLCAGGMLVLSFGFKRSTLRLSAVFAAVSFVLCGAVYAIELLQGQAPQRWSNALFFPVSFFSLLLTSAAVALACRLLLPKLTHATDSILPLTLALQNRRVHLSALRDSGNTLCDPVTGAKVLTVYWKSARGLLPPELPVSENDFAAPAVLALRLKQLSPRLIPYRAVGVASGLLLALPCKIMLEKKCYTGLVAFSPTPVSDGGAYDALTGGN